MASAYAALVVLAVSVGAAQAQTPVMTNGGTIGKLPKWTGTGTLGNSIITETSTGRIGIGTSAPAYKLSVAGTIQSTTGGFRFPNGTTQTTAGLTAVAHDGTLTGTGTSGSPLKLTVPLSLYGSTAISSEVIDVTTDSPDWPAAHFLKWNGGSAALFVQGYGTGYGAEIYSDSSTGVYAWTGSPTGRGITAVNGYAGGTAGFFQGNVQVTGTLSKSGGSFKIDHPLDPENKYLSHSFVESPDMMNIYNGNVALDANGEAVVELPEWFGALNSDFRYQLTSIGGPAVLYVAEEIADNHFKIAGGKAGMKVSWQVTGVRQDAWANKHRIPIEEDKPEAERGYYLTPEAFDQPEEKSVEWARHPEQMQRMKAEREQMKAEAPVQEAPNNQ